MPISSSIKVGDSAPALLELTDPVAVFGIEDFEGDHVAHQRRVNACGLKYLGLPDPAFAATITDGRDQTVFGVSRASADIARLYWSGYHRCIIPRRFQCVSAERLNLSLRSRY